MLEVEGLSKIQLLTELAKIEEEERKTMRVWDDFVQVDCKKGMEIHQKTRKKAFFSKVKKATRISDRTKKEIDILLYAHDNGQITEVTYTNNDAIFSAYYILSLHIKADQTLKKSILPLDKKLPKLMDTESKKIVAEESLIWLVNEGFIHVKQFDDNDDYNGGILNKCDLISSNLLKTKDTILQKVKKRLNIIYIMESEIVGIWNVGLLIVRLWRCLGNGVCPNFPP